MYGPLSCFTWFVKLFTYRDFYKSFIVFLQLHNCAPFSVGVSQNPNETHFAMWLNKNRSNRYEHVCKGSCNLWHFTEIALWGAGLVSKRLPTICVFKAHHFTSHKCTKLSETGSEVNRGCDRTWYMIEHPPIVSTKDFGMTSENADAAYLLDPGSGTSKSRAGLWNPSYLTPVVVKKSQCA